MSVNVLQLGITGEIVASMIEVDYVIEGISQVQNRYQEFMGKQLWIVFSTYPQDGQSGAEIFIHPNRQWLYVSHRGFGSVIVFDIVPAGEGYLAQKQWVTTTGITPR